METPHDVYITWCIYTIVALQFILIQSVDLCYEQTLLLY